MGFHSRARVTKSRSIARVVAPPAPQIFSPSAAATLTLTGQTPPDFLAAWRPSSSATLTLTGQTPTWSPPLTISGLVAWFAADRIVGLSDGAAVSTWSDISGFGHDLAQATGSQQPLYKTSILNGHPVVRFDSTDYMKTATFTLAQPYTVFIVCCPSDVTTAGNHILADGNSIDTGMMFFNVAAPGSAALDLYAGGTVVSGQMATVGEYLVFEAIFNGASSIANKNGTGTTGDAGTATPSGLTLCARADGFTPLTGDVAEVLIYNSGLSSGNRSTLRSYLGSKYGISVA